MESNAEGPARRALGPDHYVSPGDFQAETAAIFAKSWRLIGHQNMMPIAGDFLLDQVAGRPVVVVRGANGETRGYHNICPHRAGALFDAETGNCGAEIVCRYHGWRFALDGRLRAARDFGAASNFDPRDFALTPVRIDNWRGFLFANLDPDAAPVGDLLAPIARAWEDTEVPPFRLKRVHRIACNWKTYVENYLEGYHVPIAHPSLDREIDSAAYRVELEGEVAHHFAPSRDPARVYAGYWGWAWPWLGVNVYRRGVMMERITPVAVNETQLDYLYFFEEGDGVEFDRMMLMSDAVTAEDKTLCETVARNLRSGAYAPGLLSPKHEQAVGWFQARCASAANYGS